MLMIGVPRRHDLSSEPKRTNKQTQYIDSSCRSIHGISHWSESETTETVTRRNAMHGWNVLQIEVVVV